MIAEIVTCLRCRHPIPVLADQAVIRCNHCNARYTSSRSPDPPLRLRPTVELAKAKEIVRGRLLEPGFLPGFASRSRFEKATLYFIPFFEHMGIQAGVKFGEPVTFAYSSFQHLSPANDGRSIELGMDGHSSFTEILQKGQEETRSTTGGIQLLVNLPAPKNRSQGKGSMETVEERTRKVEFPVWEITYTCEGLLFKGYIDAVAGIPLKVRGFHDSRKNLWQSFAGLSFLAFSLSLALRSGWLPLMALWVFLFAGLFPFLWELFLCHDLLERGPEEDRIIPMGYVEPPLIRWIKKLFNEWGQKDDRERT